MVKRTPVTEPAVRWNVSLRVHCNLAPKEITQAKAVPELENDTDLLSARPATLSSVSYEKTDSNAINVVGVFYDIKGESGKLRIKQGRKFTLNCLCSDGILQCKRGFTDVNKNFIPHLSADK